MKDSRFSRLSGIPQNKNKYAGKILCLVLIGLVTYLGSGCATIQRGKKVKELEREVAQLTQLIKEKEDHIAKLAELLNNQQKQIKEQEFSHKGQLERLQRELNEYKTRLKLLERKQPNLK